MRIVPSTPRLATAIDWSGPTSPEADELIDWRTWLPSAGRSTCPNPIWFSHDWSGARMPGRSAWSWGR